RGVLIVHADAAAEIAQVFRSLFTARFPIERMEPVDSFGGDDDRSMEADNTSAFNCRSATGNPDAWSEHAYGRAIDVNPLLNPWVDGDTVLPPQGRPYADRTRTDPGMIHEGDACVAAFAAAGWGWGGRWTSVKDYQHFSATGR
ncbi:MAG: M15 family metallopeptidase, partial [Actinobacteria bacterium]|nr:M15 family metallopeptidase [Actinomycetota bacterium]